MPRRRYMQLEGLQTLSDTAPTRLSAVARFYEGYFVKRGHGGRFTRWRERKPGTKGSLRQRLDKLLSVRV